MRLTLTLLLLTFTAAGASTDSAAPLIRGIHIQTVPPLSYQDLQVALRKSKASIEVETPYSADALRKTEAAIADIYQRRGYRVRVNSTTTSVTPRTVAIRIDVER
jgi:outer membrane protein assembly factor BamA